MNKFNVSVFILVLAGCSALCQAAGGIKGSAVDSQRIAANGAAIKGPRQQNRVVLQQTQFVAPQAVRAPIAPVAAPISVKGPGQVTPIFSALRVQPLQPAPQPIAPQVFAQQPLPAPLPIQQQQLTFAARAPQLPQQQEQVIEQVQQQVPIQQQQQPQQQQEQEQEPSEVDPNAAAQDSQPAAIAPAALAPVAVAPAAAGSSEEEANPRPEPYAFRYGFESGDSASSGSSLREEQQDASGTVTGFYTLKGEDGRDRRVDYIADGSGFRATISTNEMGTAPKDAADAKFQAQGPSDGQLRAAEAAFQASRQREAISQQPIASASASNGRAKTVAFAQQPIASASSSASQLQEPFEQIRQTELNSRARKSRHAPFYLYTN